MGQCRDFTPDLEQLASRWINIVCTTDAWSPDGPPGSEGGIGAGFYVTNGSVSGFAKPSKAPDPTWGTNHATNPVAAHEKIAADLASKLSLPVPPAVLWDRGIQKNGSPRHCVISALAFKPAFKWSQVMKLPRAGAQMLPAISTAASAMLVYDTWIDNRDRINAGNLIVTRDGSTDVVRCAYIDFAQTMTFGWLDRPVPSLNKVIGPDPGAISIDRSSLYDTVEKIERLTDQEIEAIVLRVPEGFLTTKRQTLIVEGLASRRDQLRAAMISKYGEA